MEVEQTYNQAKFLGKLYSLTHESAWEDIGTGFVSVIGPEDCKRLIFKSESGDILHDRPVFSGETYQLQGEGARQTIVVWEDPETEKDWALSFQDPDGTLEVWEALSDADAEDRRLLPLPRLGALAECSRLLTFVPPVQREILASECLTSKFIATLRESFHTVEDLGNEEALCQVWQIVKGAFLLSNQKLTERLLGSDAYEDVLGMLEYDDGLPKNKRTLHRQIMKDRVRFSEVLSFEDSAMLERVHLNYRLQYLKDIVLPRILDDAAFISLNQMIQMNLTVILDYLRQSTQLLDRLFLQIGQMDLQSLLFLQDACRLAKQIPPSERLALHEKMVERNIFKVLAPFLVERPPATETTVDPRLCAVEILLISATNDPASLRVFLMNTDSSKPSADGRALLSAILRLILFDGDQGVQGQLCELLRYVLDTTALEQQDRDQCLKAFYEQGGMDELVAPLRQDAEAQCSMFGMQNVYELLTLAVAQHGDWSKTYVLRHGLTQHTVRLMASPHRYLQLAPLRLIKAMVASRDEAYHRNLAESGVFAPLLENFRLSLQPPALGGNMVVSATLELLEIIRVDNLKMLVAHLCGAEHRPKLVELAPLGFKTLEGILLRHEQAFRAAGKFTVSRTAGDSSDTDVEGLELQKAPAAEAGEPCAAAPTADVGEEPPERAGDAPDLPADALQEEGEAAEENKEPDAKMAQSLNHVAKKLRMCASVQT